jgi:glycosyltransferase involved in cell wall biosynthesis
MDLSIVIVTYDRSELLTEVVSALKAAVVRFGYSYEIVVADDCSTGEHRRRIDNMGGVRIVRARQNQGWGANANSGCANARGEYLLQLQDDWRFICKPKRLADAFEFLRLNSDIGIVQLTRVGTDLPFERRTFAGEFFRVFRNDRCPWVRECSVRPYSDQPHLKRRKFVQDIKGYLEGVPMTQCENDYKRRVANQSRWKVAMMEGEPCFIHLGEGVSFNPGGRRHPLVRFLRCIPFGESILEPSLRSMVTWIDHALAKLLSAG